MRRSINRFGMICPVLYTTCIAVKSFTEISLSTRPSRVAASPLFCHKAASSALHYFPFSMVDEGRNAKAARGHVGKLACSE